VHRQVHADLEPVEQTVVAIRLSVVIDSTSLNFVASVPESTVTTGLLPKFSQRLGDTLPAGATSAPSTVR
jgi:hypothetical protein